MYSQGANHRNIGFTISTTDLLIDSPIRTYVYAVHVKYIERLPLHDNQNVFLTTRTVTLGDPTQRYKTLHYNIDIDITTAT